MPYGIALFHCARLREVNTGGGAPEEQAINLVGLGAEPPCVLRLCRVPGQRILARGYVVIILSRGQLRQLPLISDYVSTGFVIGRETPDAVLSEDGEHIDLYAMAALNRRATQELLERIEQLEKMFDVTIDITTAMCYTMTKMKPRRLHQIFFWRITT